MRDSSEGNILTEEVIPFSRDRADALPLPTSKNTIYNGETV